MVLLLLSLLSPGSATVDPPHLGQVRINLPHVQGALLFADELRPVQAALARRLEAASYAVIPLDVQEDAIRLALRGERLSDGGRCATPYTPDALLAHLFPHAMTADLRAECERDGQGCALGLTLWGAPGSEQAHRLLAVWEAPLPGPPDLASVLAAVGQLQPAPGGVGYGGLGMGSGRPEPAEREVRVADVESAGAWGPGGAQAALAALDFDRCWADYRRDNWVNPLIVAVDAGGQVQRCESRYPNRLPEAESACGCEVLRAASFPPGAADRRARLELRSDGPDPRDGAGQRISAWIDGPYSETPGLTWAGSNLGGRRVAACLAGLPRAQRAAIPVRYEVDASGAPLRWSADWPAWIDAGAQGCLERELAEIRFGCPVEPATSEVSLTLNLDASAR